MQGNHLETLFPNLATSGYNPTSQQTDEYNCIAWAAGDMERWWWPSKNPDLAYWPSAVPREATLERFVEAYETLGYQTCENPDSEEGFEKVAIYVSAKGLPTHAARQLPTGVWTSKLGGLEDIEHTSLAGVDCDTYGSTSTILKRPLTAAPQELNTVDNKAESEIKDNAIEDDATPFERFENMARNLFNVPKHELEEEIAKEKAEGKAEKPPRTADTPKTKKAA